MGGFWAGLLRGAGKRPFISQEDTADAAKLNELVDWFITNEEGVRRHISSILRVLLLMGYTAPLKVDADAQLQYREGIEFCGLRNQATFYIWSRLAGIRAKDGKIREVEMEALLQEIGDNLRQTVLHLRSYDSTGELLTEFLRLAEPFDLEFLQLQQRQDVVSAIPLSRTRFEHGLFTTKHARHLGAVFVSKNFSEIVFYILCWFYYSWYGRQFYSPPLP